MIEDILMEFQKACELRFPNSARGGLLNGASEADVARAEAVIGLRYPADLKAAYLFSNGAHDNLFPWFKWLPLGDRVYELWARQKTMEQDGNWVNEWVGYKEEADENGAFCYGCPVDSKRIPLGDDGSSWYFYADMNPARGGWKGQIIEVDDTGVKWWAPSFSDYLSRWLTLVSTGELFYTPGGRWDVVDPDLSVREVFIKPWE